MTHEEVWHRIPWYVNGRADESERLRIEAHVRQCEECKAEVSIQRQVMNAIATDTRIDCMPGMSFQRLWDRIRADEVANQRKFGAAAPVHGHGNGHENVHGHAHSHGNGPAPAPEPAPLATKRVANRSLTRWLAVAVVVEAIGITALTATFLGSRESGRLAGPADYQTVTSTAAPPARGAIRAVFSPSLAVNDLQRLLEKSGLQIVAGPTEAGVYTLAVGGSEDRTRALAELRADPAVRFAEPIAK